MKHVTPSTIVPPPVNRHATLEAITIFSSPFLVGAGAAIGQFSASFSNQQPLGQQQFVGAMGGFLLATALMVALAWRVRGR